MINQATLAAWLYGLMVAILPADKAVKLTKLPAAIETVEEREGRYKAISQAIAHVVMDPKEAPIFAGDQGRAISAATVLAVSYFESGWRKDVDLGIGKGARGEGVDSCLMQLRIGKGATREGWTHEDLTSDRDKCVRAGYHLMRQSFAACKDLPVEERLSAYASGSCKSELGQKRSRDRVLFSRTVMARNPIPKTNLIEPEEPPKDEIEILSLK